MSAQLPIVATIRGRAAFEEVRDLFEQLVKVDADADAAAAMSGPIEIDGSQVQITADELRGVIHRRRESLLNKLQNKGIRIAPDPEVLPPHAIEEVAHIGAATA